MSKIKDNKPISYQGVFKSISVIIKGGGDVASGVAYNLYKAKIKFLILEIDNPLSVRRKVSFAQAVIDGKTTVEGVTAVFADNYEKVERILSDNNIPVIADTLSDAVNFFKPDIVIDATIAKKSLGLKKNIAPLTIALGPGLEAGKDADVVIETNRGKNLGKIIRKGFASANTGIPASVMGYTKERVLRAPKSGVIKNVLDIGDYVKKGDIICYVNDAKVKSPFNGTVRGLIMNNRAVSAGLKIGDVDPRADRQACYTISDKAHIIGKAVLKVVFDSI
ncbi:MAG: EF2563 family selenium-dependent molybdenum hydroxylase system protein [Deltaproteobacteria bacterium]|nr:EF2563 family selenium-dependent molybdenum hydroxylase system protein [Deltaproteobacteria bacterium]